MPRLEITFLVKSIALLVAHLPVAPGVLLFLALLGLRVPLWRCLEALYLPASSPDVQLFVVLVLVGKPLPS